MLLTHRLVLVLVALAAAVSLLLATSGNANAWIKPPPGPKGTCPICGT